MFNYTKERLLIDELIKDRNKLAKGVYANEEIKKENVNKQNTDKNLKRNKGIAKGRNRKMVVKKNLSEYRTTKQLLALALSNRFTDKEYQTMRTRSEEFKSIKFRKRVR